VILEKAIWFRHLDYDPDRAQTVHVPTRNISSKSMHTFLSNLANRQTDRQTRAKTCTSSFVGGNKPAQNVQFTSIQKNYNLSHDALQQPLPQCKSVHSQIMTAADSPHYYEKIASYQKNLIHYYTQFYTIIPKVRVH